MIVVRPAQAEPVLAHLLDLRRAIASLPIRPLSGKHHLASQIASDQPNDAIQGGLQVFVALLVAIEISWTRFPQFVRFDERGDLARLGPGRSVAAVAAAFNGFQPRTVFKRNQNPSKARKGIAFRLSGDALGDYEIGEAFGANGNGGGEWFGTAAGILTRHPGPLPF